MGERELNIFSWRAELRGMTHQERVNFYYEKLQAGYQESVLEAELARQRARRPGDSCDEEIQELFGIWASEETQERLNSALERRRGKGLDVTKGEKIVDLGLAGHFRIKQVHETTMAIQCRWWEEAERRRRFQAANEVFARWPSVKRTTSNTPHTIHGGSINWELEVTQDIVKYLHAAGDNDSAIKTAEKGISLGLRKIGAWLLENLPKDKDVVVTNIDLKLDEIKEKVPEEKFLELIGLLSSKAVLEYRKGLYSRELGPLIGALRDISAVQKQIPNNHRFATINWHMLFAAFVYGGNYSFKERLGYFLKATRNLLKTGKKDPKSVIRSLLQML